MTFDEILNSRRSVRAYDSRPVKDEEIVAMCEAARLAPSACNSQTWRFVAVTDRQRIDRLCHEAMRPVIRNSWLRQAPLIIAGCSQLDIVANRIGAGITGIEYYQIDLGIAMEHMALKATELGLGTCWVGWFNEEKVKEILRIPKRVRVSALLAVGYPKDIRPPKRSRKPLHKILFSETWGHPLPTETALNSLLMARGQAWLHESSPEANLGAIRFKESEISGVRGAKGSWLSRLRVMFHKASTWW